LFASYNRLQPGDEADSFVGLSLLRTEIIEPQIQKFGGRMIRWTGDEVLLEFESAVEALRCAVALGEAVSNSNDSLLPDQRIALRIGKNLADIIVEGGEIFGDGVNIASRIEALAEPGTIYISAAVYDRIVGKIDFDFIDLGPQNLKNISKPIRVYRMDADVAMRWAAAASAGTGSPAGARFDDRRAIAVLPFANFGGDGDQEYFADGITEDIISMLADWRAFPVIARNSTFNYKGTTVDVRAGGEGKGRVVRAALRRQIFEQPVVTLSPDSLALDGKRNRTPGPTVGARISIPALNFDAAIIADRSFSPRSGRLTARIRLCSATLLKPRRAI
jgi:adenylate cyclase